MGWVGAVTSFVMLAVGVRLAETDLREHRLPNRLTLPLFGVLLVVLFVSAGVLGDWPRLGASLLGATLMSGLYALLALVPGGMGMGDVKLALSIGLLTGWWGWTYWSIALISAFGFGSIAALWQLVRRRGTGVHIAFGPAMLLGWAVATVAALA